MAVQTIKPFGKVSSQVIKISICDQNPDLIRVFVQIFANEDHVEILQGNLLNLKADALISPANSFGDMSGGLDKTIDDFYFGRAQEKVQTLIQKEYFGEMPVGVAEILPMANRQFPFLIIAPTMRIPGNVARTINAYLSMRAIVVAIQKHNQRSQEKIKHIALSALCTGVGGMHFQESAEQMHTAVQQILTGQWKNVNHPALAPYPLGAKWVFNQKRNKFRNND